MEKNNIKYFGFATTVFVAIVFLFNINHLNQQGTYENIFRQISINLIDGNGYTCTALGNIPLLYPLWGYTGLVLIDTLFEFNGAFILIVQFLLCTIVINLFYKIYKITPKYRHLLYMLPFIALMTVKWPDAIVGALLFVYGYFILQSLFANGSQQKVIIEKLTINYSQLTIKEREERRRKTEDGRQKPDNGSQKTEERRSERSCRFRYIVYTGITLGVILNFRTEYLLMPLVFFVFLFFPQMKGKRKVLFQTTTISWIIALIMLSPWAFRAKNISGDLQFTASNSGAVMYLSLGQLPNNKWGISPYDKTVYDIADSLGYPSPYSYQGNAYFNQKSSELILNSPVEFAKKIGYNFFSVCKGGVYTGEYANYFISESRRNEIDNLINASRGIINKIKVIFNLKLSESISLFSEKVLQGIFIPVVFLLLVLFVFSYYKQKDDYMIIVFLVGAAIILYKVATVCLVQYEYRHINSIYLFLLGIGMTTFVSKEKV